MTSTQLPTLTEVQIHNMVSDAREILVMRGGDATAVRLAEAVVDLYDADGQDDATWTVCDNCTRSVRSTQVANPQCAMAFLGFCPDCTDTHNANCAVCAGA